MAEDYLKALKRSDAERREQMIQHLRERDRKYETEYGKHYGQERVGRMKFRASFK